MYGRSEKMTGYIILFIYLFIMAIYDVKKREIHLPFSAVAALVLIARQLYFIAGGKVTVAGAFLGVCVGIVLIMVSIVTRGGIGIGDGILFMVCGLFFGFYENSVLLFLSLILTAFVSGVLIIVRQVGRKYTLPFAPFVFVGYGVMCVWKVFG